jgi:hypothetical protein
MQKTSLLVDMLISMYKCELEESANISKSGEHFMIFT